MNSNLQKDRLLALEKFPDQNPNPVIRLSLDGKLLYYNPASKKIVKTWKIKINDSIEEKIFSIVEKSKLKEQIKFEFTIESRIFSFQAFYIKKLMFFNIYGTDITALKTIDKFPDQNPNPVLRVTESGTLNYFNEAASIIVKYYKFKLYKEITDPLLSLVNKSIKKEISDHEIQVDNKTYLLNH